MPFTTLTKLLGNLNADRVTDTFERRFQNRVKASLIVIDDFGLKPMRQPHDSVCHDLIAERYERGATIVTSNLDFSEWGDDFTNQLLRAATLDRLRYGAYRLVLDGESYCRPRPLAEDNKNAFTEEVKRG